MAELQRIVTLQLNQQQLELIDKTIKGVGAADYEDLVRQALRDFITRRRVSGRSRS